MACFGLKQGQDLENWAAHPHHKFREVFSPPRGGRGGEKPWFTISGVGVKAYYPWEEDHGLYPGKENTLYYPRGGCQSLLSQDKS